MCIMDIMIKLFGVDKKASMIVVLEFKTPIPLQLLKLDIFSQFCLSLVPWLKNNIFPRTEMISVGSKSNTISEHKIH